MSMAQLQESPCSTCNGTSEFPRLAVIADIDNEVKHWSSEKTFGRRLFEPGNFAENFVKRQIVSMGVPETFASGSDCNMIQNLVRMLRDSMLPCPVGLDVVCVLVSVSKGRCFYSVVNTMPNFLSSSVLPSSKQVQRIAFQSGEYSLPAGATSLTKVEAEDNEENCAICLEGLNSSVAGKLPCSHVCHYDCILEWFVKSGTCPLCRFQSNPATDSR